MDIILGLLTLAYAVFFLVLPFTIASLKRKSKNFDAKLWDIHANQNTQRQQIERLSEQVERLERRLLEQRLQTLGGAPPTPAEFPAEPAVPAQPVPAVAAAVPETIMETPPAPEELKPAMAADVNIAAIAETPVVPRPPKPKVPVQSTRAVPRRVSGEDLEAVIGGDWLNKLGAVILVIGIALFLGYSFMHLTPVGRLSIALAVSLALLLGGVFLERETSLERAKGEAESWRVFLDRKDRYRHYAWGLIGGGWAALYFTTYAAHGLEAARVIENPLLGMALLAAVAVGMILHSLHYRSQVVTGLAYFIGFVTLGISPVSQFSLWASLPLALSLLVVAYRFSWFGMVVMGLVATYGIYALGYGAQVLQEDFLSTGQGMLVVYWLFFEAFDLLNIFRGGRDFAARTVFPLNAAGFIGVSLLHWPAWIQGQLHIFFAASAAAYFASTLLRARLRPPSSFPVTAYSLDRAAAGGYEEAVSLAAVLAAIAIFERFPFAGLQFNLAFLLEGELLFLAGRTLEQPFLRLLGNVVLAVPVLKLIRADVLESEQILWAGMQVHAWTPLALLTAVLLYGNRIAASLGRSEDVLYSELLGGVAASVILAMVLYFEMPPAYLGVGYLLFAAALFEIGIRQVFAEFRLQAYAVGGLGLVVLIGGGHAGEAPWTSLGLGAVIAYAAGVRAAFIGRERLPEAERLRVRDTSLTAGAVLAACLLWYVLPNPLIAVGWGLLGLALLSLGFTLPLPILRLHAHLLFGIAFLRLFMANFTLMGETAGLSHRILTVAPFVILFYMLSSQLKGVMEQLAAWERPLARWYLYAPAILAVVLIRFELGRTQAVAGWAVLGFVLLYSGLRRREADFRWQSYILALLTFARCWATNFYIPESLGGMSIPLVIGGLVTSSFFAAEFLSPRAPQAPPPLRQGIAGWLERFDLHARTGFGLLASVLLAILLYYEIPAKLLTVAWALEGAAILGLGFAARERVLRLSGVVLLLSSIAKVLAVYLPESLGGFSVRLITGVLVTGSFFAAEFLSPRAPQAPPPVGQGIAGWLERFDLHARTGFGLLASVLLAALLYDEIPAKLLTVAWALEGVAIFGVGFVARERVLRLSGLILLLFCIAKVLAFDIRELEAVFRILSFIVLGLILLGVSLIYTRFREQIRRYF